MGGTGAAGVGIAAELRNWAAGTLWARAAVELVVGGVGGRLAHPGAPWIERLGTGQDGKPYARINPEKLAGSLGGMSSGERFTAKVVANLIDGETPVPLADIARLDPAQAGLVLGALRMAAGLGAAAPARPAPGLPPVSVFGRAPSRPDAPRLGV